MDLLPIRLHLKSFDVASPETRRKNPECSDLGTHKFCLACFAAIIAPAIALTTSPAFAAEIPMVTEAQKDALHGVGSLATLVMFAGSDKSCRPDEQKIETDILFVLRQSRWKVTSIDDQSLSDQSKWPRRASLMITGDTMRTSGGSCIFTYTLAVSDQIDGAPLISSGKRWSGAVHLWETSYFGIQSPASLTTTIAHRVENELKRLVLAVE